MLDYQNVFPYCYFREFCIRHGRKALLDVIIIQLVFSQVQFQKRRHWLWIISVLFWIFLALLMIFFSVPVLIFLALIPKHSGTNLKIFGMDLNLCSNIMNFFGYGCGPFYHTISLMAIHVSDNKIFPWTR